MFAVLHRCGAGIKLESLIKGSGVGITYKHTDFSHIFVCDPQQVLGCIDSGKHQLFLKADAIERVNFPQDLPLGAMQQLGKILLGTLLRGRFDKKSVDNGHILCLPGMRNGHTGQGGHLLDGAKYLQHQLWQGFHQLSEG